MINYTSLEGLSSRTNDFVNVYILPFINNYNVIVFLLATCVLSSKKLKGDLNNLLLLSSIIGLLMYSFNNILSIIRCGALCPWGYEYISKQYEWFIYLYLGRSCELIQVFCDIHMLIIKLRAFSFDRENNIREINNSSKKKFFLIISCYFIISLLFYITPTFYRRSIVQIGYLVANQTSANNNETLTIIKRPLFILYKDNSADSINSLVQLLFPAITLLLYVLITVLNCLVYFKLKTFLSKKMARIPTSKLND